MEAISTFGYGSLTLFGGPFQGPSPSVMVYNFLETQQRLLPDLTTPEVHRPAGR